LINKQHLKLLTAVHICTFTLLVQILLL